MNQTNTRKRYTTEFKAQAVEMATLRGDIPAVATELQIHDAHIETGGKR